MQRSRNSSIFLSLLESLLNRPLVVVTIGVAVGIALGERVGPLPFVVVAGCTSLLVAVLLHEDHSLAAVVFLALAACSAGILLYRLATFPPGPDHIASFASQRVLLRGIIDEVDAREGRVRLVLEARSLVSGMAARPVHGRILVSLHGAPALSYGDLVEVRGRIRRPPDAGNPGEFSYRKYLARRGILAILSVRRGEEVRVLRHGHGKLLGAVRAGIREKFSRGLAKGMPPPYGEVLSALTFGTTPPKQVAEMFARAGVVHLLVVSGFHVGLVAGTVLTLLRLVRLPQWVGVPAAAAVVSAFAFVVGPHPSVVRATIMVLLALAGLLLEREKDVWTALAFSGLVILLVHPLALFTSSLQLSFAATAGILYIARDLVRHLPLPRLVGTLIGVSLAAQLATAPLVATTFGRISLVAPLANLVAVPLSVLIVPLGLLAAVVGLFADLVAAALLGFLRPLVQLLLGAVGWFASLPSASVEVPPPGAWITGGMYAAGCLVVEMARRRVRPTTRQVAMACITLSAVVIWVQVAGEIASRRLTIIVMDVGQGDAIVIRSPSGKVALIDAGGAVEGYAQEIDVGEERVVPFLRRLRVRRIDLLVLSHPHEDHVGGVPAVLRSFPVGVVWDSGFEHQNPSYPIVLRMIRASHIPYYLARRGDAFDLGAGVRVIVLSPTRLDVGTGSDINNNSLVLKLVYGRVSVLLPGDIESSAEDLLLGLGEGLRSTALKVAHHGSETSSTWTFLRAVRPEVAVISVGEGNPFGHPDARTLKALAGIGARIYRTDLHGAVTLISDGRKLWVNTFRPPRP
ncbi:MAG: DNA internalization-related competence protein ComEC/Rec2 [Armatimonadota bacterium]|nr:DNA internalization-related competence protein ComEC/Rec2 [Armatimonadota bacterium]